MADEIPVDLQETPADWPRILQRACPERWGRPDRTPPRHGPKVRHAQRVKSKLPTPKVLLRVLQNLRYVTRDQIKQAVVTSKVPIPLGALLVELGVIGDAELETALALQKERAGTKFGHILVENHLLEEKTLLEVFSLRLGYPKLSPAAEPLDPELLKLAPAKWYREHEIVPITRRDGAVVLALAYRLDLRLVVATRRIFGENLIIGVARSAEITEALDRLDAGRTRAGTSVGPQDNLVVQTVNQIINDAAEANASDIHIEPLRDGRRVRFRRDGVLVTYKEFPKDLAAPHKRLLKNVPFSLRLRQLPRDLLPMAERVGQSLRGEDGSVNFPKPIFAFTPAAPAVGPIRSPRGKGFWPRRSTVPPTSW